MQQELITTSVSRIEGRNRILTPQSIPTLFVVGLPRSGTTLLGYLLAGGDDVLCLSEPYFHRALRYDWLFRWSFHRMLRSSNIYQLSPPRNCDDNRFLQYLQELAVRNGSKNLVIKETYRLKPAWENTELLNHIASGSCQVVAIIRNPYDTVLSTIRFMRFGSTLFGKAFGGILHFLLHMLGSGHPRFTDNRQLVQYVARNWVDFLDWCKRHHLFVVRYEDLVNDPRTWLQKLCDNSGVPFDEHMLDHQHPRTSFGGIGDPGIMNRPPKPVNIRSTGRKHLLASEYRQIIADECATAAQEFGYTL